ncbi:F-box domain protein [Aspergillus clavatus NRRL 1]|uniref:F-box domain protein n=1 Tax=Aspergillus clavatus (strain ATCC 1007 / CBS 513.65 / DSM 816 / NCTC 3887 / NRRL 1 / QM 1276 / 107) TaxID=344612 RepID=A1CDP8_ASPCL|nr:F-box domain protein [Aspergillus clavatus NRRL 1]EAW11975.1 F-box domain protein [Aspergillus clavatus NRRL 1]
MSESSTITYPTSLDTLYNETSPLREQYDSVKLEDAQIVPILELPLALEVLGCNSADSSAIDRVSDGELCYTTFVTEKAKAVSQMPLDGLSPAQQQSQLLHIGLAALFSFLQSNITGPPLGFNPAEVVLPSALRSDAAKLRAVRSHIIRELSVDGEAAYKLTPNVELFALAKALLVDAGILIDGPLMARAARLRVNFLHQKMLSEPTSTLQDAIYKDLDVLSNMLIGEKSVFSTAQEKGRFLLERAMIHTHHGFDAKARADLEQAAAVRGFEFALTGRLGKRTKFQERDVSQLVVLAKSAERLKSTGNAALPEETEDTKQAGPKNLELNDDTLLESISFTKSDETSQDKSMTVQEESTLPPALQSLDPGNQPLLDPVDSAILLGLASAITNTSPENGLTREETHPYAVRVLEGGSSNWQIYTQALLVRSRVEGYRSRTVERAVLQMQALVDQVIADTASLDTQATENTEQPTTFLPRPEKSESASAAERLEYIWILSSPTRWSLEAELAQRWVDLGGLRTALEIYERLHMWAEAALCYAATEREEKAKHIVRRQLYQPTGTDPDDENEKFDGPELSPLPADAPRLLCILGDIESDPSLYERAWEASNHRYARAQRSLARHYLALRPPALDKAEEAYRKSLHVNRLNHGAWFALGCVQLELEKWEDAIDSFTRTVQLEDNDAEAWSNLAAAILRTPKPGETTEIAEAPQQSSADTDVDADSDSEPAKAPEAPYKRKREALAALHRAAQLKHTDARIWDNVLTVAASIPPPATPFRDAITAQRRVIELLGAKNGEKSVDIPILSMLIDHLVSSYNYEDLVIKVDEKDEKSEQVVRSGTIPGQILALVDQCVVPLITHSAPLWLLVARVEQFREQPSKAFEAHEKAWRATVASCTQGAFQMGDEKKWMDVVRATERLVRDGYAKFGPMDKEGQHEGEPEMVAKDWRFKARSAVRGILGKGKDFWEDSEGWNRLKELQTEVGSS